MDKSDSRTADVVYTPFTFSAACEKSLIAMIGAFSRYVKDVESISLRDLAFTLQNRRSEFPIKLAVSAINVDDLLLQLDSKLLDINETIGVRSSLGPRRILGVFTGQGAQWYVCIV